MTETQEKEMIPIPINEFITGLLNPVDIYVRLPSDKFILIAKKGTKTQKEHLTTYKNKAVEYLWVEKKKYNKITKQKLAIAGVIISNKDLSTKQKTYVVTAAAQSVFNELDHMGISMDTFNHAKQVTEATVALVETHPDLASIMESLKDCSDDLLRHSMAVSACCVLIGQALEWVNKINLEKLALGGLLHDIGKKSLQRNLIEKAIVDMSPEEIQTYETHPYRGMQMLVSIGIVPDDVVSMVYEHHENSIGQGYPQKIRDIKIHPMARVIAVADTFVNLVWKNSNCINPMNPREALITIEHTMAQPFNKEAFKALQKVVNKELAQSA